MRMTRLPSNRRLAIGIESISHYLRCLTSGHIVEGSEVWSLLVVTRFIWSPTWIPAHHSQVGEAHYPQVEWIVFRYVCIEDAARCAIQPCCVGDYLRELPSCSVSEWPEVWSVSRGVAWLLWYAAAWVASHKASVGEAVYPLVEGVGATHIFIKLWTWVLLETGSITHNLSYLPPGDVILRAEVAVILRVARFPWPAALVA